MNEKSLTVYFVLNNISSSLIVFNISNLIIEMNKNNSSNESYMIIINMDVHNLITIFL